MKKTSRDSSKASYGLAPEEKRHHVQPQRQCQQNPMKKQLAFKSQYQKDAAKKICYTRTYYSHKKEYMWPDLGKPGMSCHKNVQAVQCALLVPRVKKCQSRVFGIFMSKNLSTNLCRRLTISYKGEISFHFDLHSLYSCRTRSPLLWALIRIPASGLSRYS